MRGAWRSMRSRAAQLAAVLVAVGAASLAQAAPEVDLHDLRWFVHVDLVDPGAGRDLDFWQDVIDAATGFGSDALVGRNGPADQPCCTRLARSVPVATFGSPGDGFDVIDSSAEENALDSIGGSGSRAFLVDSLTWCGGSAPSAIGCAELPGCSGNPNDDPNLWLTVTVESFESGSLAAVLAHERGHNACLQHVTAETCQLMQPTVFGDGVGGCLTQSECTNYANARTESSSGLECGCLDDVGGVLADGDVCDAIGGVCSGGLCGPITSDAGVSLLAAGDSGDLGFPPEEALRVSTLSGDWTSLGLFAGTQPDVRGLAFATDSATLFGVVPTVGDDTIVTIDPETGAILATVGTISNGTDELVSLAYDPGPTSAPGDDRLLTLEVATDDTGQVRSIDPASPNGTTLLGSLGWTPASAFTGLAFDPTLNRLFFASPFWNSDPVRSGLWELDMASCPPSCSPTQGTAGTHHWADASLAYSPDSGRLYAAGTEFFSGSPTSTVVTFYDVIDPATGASFGTLNLDRFTPAGLAAVPEPGLVIGVTAGVLALALTARRRPPTLRGE